MTPIRKIFTVIINNKPYDVYDIDGKEHQGLNGEPKTWWLYHSQRLPQEVMPPIDSPYWTPFHTSINRLLWDIEIKQHNTTKEKWGATQFRSSTSVKMFCNGKLIYEFSTIGGDKGMSFAMAKAQHLQVQMCEHPFNFFNPEEENGRKIYYKGLPATIRASSSSPGEIGIVPDYTCGLTKEEWWAELRRRESFIPNKKDDDFDVDDDYHNTDYINWGSALSDGYINWFRK